MSDDAHNLKIVEMPIVINFVFPERQDTEENLRHFDRNIRRTSKVVYHRQNPGGPVKNLMIFPHVLRLALVDPKQ
jgi:hypothetical protein